MLFILHVNKTKDAKVKYIAPGSLLCNIKNGVLLRFILSNRGDPFDDALHSVNYLYFINSDLGKKTIEIAKGNYCDE